jgi:hypothetical protein
MFHQPDATDPPRSDFCSQLNTVGGSGYLTCWIPWEVGARDPQSMWARWELMAGVRAGGAWSGQTAGANREAPLNVQNHSEHRCLSPGGFGITDFLRSTCTQEI